MIPASDRRVWIMFLWYLLLKCSLLTHVIPIPGASGTSIDTANSPQLGSGSNIEDLYHRILDDNEFSLRESSRFNRHSDVRDRKPQVPYEPVRSHVPRDPPRWHGSTASERVNNDRKINLESPRAGGASVGNVMNVFERLDEEEAGDVVAGSPKDPLEEDMHDQRELFEREGLASVLRDTQVQPERHRSGTEDTHHTAYKRHRRSLMRRRSIRMKETAITKAEETAGADDDSSNPHPAVVVENPTHPPVDDPKNHPSAEGASNYGIKSDSSSTRNTPGVVPTQEATIVLQNVSHEPAQEATSMVAQTTTPPQRRVPGEPQPAAIGFDSFNLLDDSVFIATGHGHRNDSGMTGRLPPLGTDLTLDEHGNIFGDGVGENFDEQIIFLNGPDLLETSVEQQQQQMASRSRRPLGKVAREALDEPQALPLRPIIRGPSEEHVVEDNVVVVYADQHETVRLNCEVDADITTSVWLKDGQIVHVMDKKSRTADIRFVREPLGGLTIQNVMLEDDGVWQCEAENARGFFFNGRPIKLIVLDPPKEPYLLIDSRRLDAGNMFIPVKENSELTLACVSEGGNPKPTLTWEVLLSPGIDRHAQKISSEVLELQEIKKDKDKEPYKINSGAISEVKLPGVFRVHHNARILCIMEHPTLKVRQNASILLDVQYTPSFAITRTPGFGYPLREGIEVSLKCDVDSNPPSTPLWQKDDGDTPVPQIGDGFLNFSSIRREHSGWYKCTSRHLNFQYSSIGYYLSVRYEPVDVTSEPVEHDLSMSPSSSSSSSSASAASSSSSVSLSSAAASPSGGNPATGSAPASEQSGSNSFKAGQMEVELGGSVTLQCPQGSLGCWSHLDPVTARLKGLGAGIYTPTGQFSLKDVVYQDAGTYKCVGQNASNRKKLEVLQTVSIAVKGKGSECKCQKYDSRRLSRIAVASVRGVLCQPSCLCGPLAARRPCLYARKSVRLGRAGLWVYRSADAILQGGTFDLRAHAREGSANVLLHRIVAGRRCRGRLPSQLHAEAQANRFLFGSIRFRCRLWTVRQPTLLALGVLLLLLLVRDDGKRWQLGLQDQHQHHQHGPGQRARRRRGADGAGRDSFSHLRHRWRRWEGESPGMASGFHCDGHWVLGHCYGVHAVPQLGSLLASVRHH